MHRDKGGRLCLSVCDASRMVLRRANIYETQFAPAAGRENDLALRLGRQDCDVNASTRQQARHWYFPCFHCVEIRQEYVHGIERLRRTHPRRQSLRRYSL